MMIVLFRSRLRPEAGDDYAAMAEEMLARARTMPGFVDFKSFQAADGERLSVIWWEDEVGLRAWATDARHQVAQRLGREKWYASFELEVTQLLRRASSVPDASVRR